MIPFFSESALCRSDTRVEDELLPKNYYQLPATNRIKFKISAPVNQYKVL